MANTEMKRLWKSEALISVFAFLISIATIGVLMYQTRLSQEQNQLVRKQQYASILPYLVSGLFVRAEKDQCHTTSERNQDTSRA
jgi:uncharacterized membrane protein